MVQPLWKPIWRFLRKLELDLPEDPAIPPLGIHTKDAPPCHKGTCSTMQPYLRYPEAGNNPDVPQWKNGYRKMWFTYTVEY